MVEANSKDRHLDDPITAAQLEKLNLEIEELKNKKNWNNRITIYTPLLSVLIAVFGFLFGIYQFQRQQLLQQTQIINEQQKDRQAKEREQEIRIQNQIRSNLEQILQFTNDKQQTTSRVLFLLEDIKANLNLSADKMQGASSKDSMKGVTAALTISVMRDCDFDQPRDVNFVKTLFDGWDDYSQYLTENTDVLKYILTKYTEAMEHIYAQDPSTISSVRFYADRPLPIEYPNGYGKLDTLKTNHFDDMVGDFSRHLELLNDKEVREIYIKNFQVATCNPILTKQYFEINFERKSDPRAFSHCPKW